MISEGPAHAGTGRDHAEAARAFLRNALAVHTVDEVGHELALAVSATLGARRTLLIVSDHVGEVRVIGAGGPSTTPDLRDTAAAFERLGARTEPALRGRLGPDDAPLSALLERLGGDVALPLRHRGALIAIAVLGPGPQPLGERELSFLRRLSHEASVAVANAHLWVERQGMAGARRQASLATAMQEALIPEERTLRRGTILLRGLYRPAGECSGDFWTWEDLGSGKVLVAIGDVTGKGVPAAMLAATAKGVACAMRVARGPELDPAEFLRALNAGIYRAAHTRWMMTCFAIVVDTDRGAFSCANAGHQFPYVVHPGSGLRQIVVRGNSLGAVPSCDYVSERRELAVGESVLLYTDGITDAVAPGGEAFGEKRLRRLLERGGQGGRALAPGQLTERLLDEVLQHLAGGDLGDDLTMVELAREGSPL
ncbi:MAG TPA: PP2C family protein-serine/threonine phosphatase [Polyangia bacterium]|nr:PP2C family protein-serine/threonine phosphatase [Polyangia bacterium]